MSAGGSAEGLAGFVQDKKKSTAVGGFLYFDQVDLDWLRTSRRNGTMT